MTKTAVEGFHPSAAESGDQALPSTTRPVILGNSCVVSSGHWLVTLAASRILLDGGNAFDAAAAATFAAAVVEPTSSFSLGAECVVMLREGSSGRSRALCGQGGAGRLATPSYFAERGHSVIPTGPGRSAPLAFTTPGMVGAILRLLEDYGTLPLAAVLAPAIEYAKSGYPCYHYMSSRLTDTGRQQLALFNSAAEKIFYPNGRAASPGTLIRQPALAAVLEQLAKAGDSGDRISGIREGRALFYTGELARKIAAASKALDGIISKEDLADYREDYEEPARTEFHGHTIACQSFWSQAPIVLQALNMLECFDLRALGFNTAPYIHLVSEVLKLAFADREAYYGDPKFTHVPADLLLSKDYARERARLLNTVKAAPALPDPGTLTGHVRSRHLAANLIETLEPESGTTHISIVDRDGNVVAVTPSGGAFGKSVFLDDLGFTLSTRSEMLNLIEGHPNCVAPGKRPRTTLVNYLSTAPNGDVFAFGCPGGDGQAQANLQIMLNTIVWGMDPQQAVEAPRFATNSMPNSFHPHAYFPGRLSLEHGIPESTGAALSGLGHEIVRAATCGMGAVVTKLDCASGVRSTSSDPRRSCHAIGW